MRNCMKKNKTKMNFIEEMYDLYTENYQTWLKGMKT